MGPDHFKALFCSSGDEEAEIVPKYARVPASVCALNQPRGNVHFARQSKVTLGGGEGAVLLAHCDWLIQQLVQITFMSSVLLSVYPVGSRQKASLG